MKPRCYVASPLGFSAAGRHYYEEVLLPALAERVEIIDPWALTEAEEIDQAAREGRSEEFAREIGRRNQQAILTANLLVAVLDGQEVDAGTASEVGYGAGIGVRCLGLRTDFRASGEAGTKTSLQLEYFIKMSGGEVHSSLDELLAAL